MPLPDKKKAERHALVTGPIEGRIPHGDAFLDVTPDHLYFDTAAEAQAAASSIEAEHLVRGTHPVQLECPVLSELGHPVQAVINAHRVKHTELNSKAGL